MTDDKLDELILAELRQARMESYAGEGTGAARSAGTLAKAVGESIERVRHRLSTLEAEGKATLVPKGDAPAPDLWMIVVR